MRQPPIHERRNYFRIEQDVLLRFVPVSEDMALSRQIPEEFANDQRFALMRTLQDIDHEGNKYLRSIVENNREVEAYLKLLNKKIDVLAGALADSLDGSCEQHNRHASISEGGLSFISGTPLDIDSHVALELTLQPSYVTLVLFAQIIHCSPFDNAFKIAMSFVDLKDTDRQLLAKHILQSQLAQKRKHKSDRE